MDSPVSMTESIVAAVKELDAFDTRLDAAIDQLGLSAEEAAKAKRSYFLIKHVAHDIRQVILSMGSLNKDADAVLRDQWT